MASKDSTPFISTFYKTGMMMMMMMMIISYCFVVCVFFSEESIYMFTYL